MELSRIRLVFMQKCGRSFTKYHRGTLVKNHRGTQVVIRWRCSTIKRSFSRGYSRTGIAQHFQSRLDGFQSWIKDCVEDCAIESWKVAPAGQVTQDRRNWRCLHIYVGRRRRKSLIDEDRDNGAFRGNDGCCRRRKFNSRV